MISLNSFLIFYLIVLAATAIIDLAIEGFNRKHIETYGEVIPEAFKGMIDPDALRKTSRYSLDNIHFTIVQALIEKIFLLIVLLSGLLPKISGYLEPLNFLAAGLLFFAFLGFLATVLGIPFDYYHSFVLEDKYGFNTQTFNTWLSDLLKSLLLTIILGSLLASALLLLIHYAGQTWWLWAWLVFIGFQLVMIVIFPTVIAPLFNNFTPVEDSDLKYKIEQVASRVGINVKGIFQMDATKRTRHTNAYLSGLGKAKRIVLFDSMIHAHTHEEILAILAHEIGHLKHHHIKKHLILISLTALLLFYLASKLIVWDIMYESFGFSNASAFTGLFLISILWGPIGYYLAPMGNLLSRHFERKADLYALEIIQTTGPLISALKKMAQDNLSNLYPHPFYVWFNYSHPPILERIRSIEAAGSSRQTHLNPS
jgi:STE24 endopeptidase